ncbi:MAG TPA: type II secretion system protein GspL [Steroidobacteraceae bacterium]|nr:type II secretion system protein GspL [Steroidobacteraceae bacterium]
MIRLPAQPRDPASWLVADAAGRVVMSTLKGSLAQAAQLAATRRVCVVVPAVDVLLTEVEIPARSGVKPQQIVPFALEEQLAEDIENLHFALGRRAGEATALPVAVVARELVERWLAELKAAQITPEALYCEADLLPVNPGQAVALLDADSVLVRPIGKLPVTMPIEALSEALDMVRLPGDAQANALVLYTGAAEWQRSSKAVESERDRFDGIKVQLLADGPLALLAQQLPQAPSQAVNLLQGPFAPQSAVQQNWKSWRLAAALLVGLIGLHIAGTAAELFAVKRAEHKAEASFDEACRAIFQIPRCPPDGRRRIEQAVRNAGSERFGLLPMLAAVAQARGGAPGTALQGVSYTATAVELKMRASNAETLEHVSQSLRASGWDATLTSGNAIASGYEGHIEMRGEPAGGAGRTAMNNR